jgi:3-oxoacyl-[acyl-carrier protein] reductase
VTINNLLPGAFDTDRLRGNQQRRAQASGEGLDAIRAAAMQGIPARRFGDAREFGDVCAFICSVQAGYLVGQNILLDGGAYPGTF